MTEERNWQKAVLEAALFQQREPASLPRLARLLEASPDPVDIRSRVPIPLAVTMQTSSTARHGGLSSRGDVPSRACRSSLDAASSEDVSSADTPARVDALSTVIPEKIAILNQGRVPQDLAGTWISLASRKIVDARYVLWVSIAQHSMSISQERVYEAIWRSKCDYLFQIEVVSRHVKRFTSGYDVLSRVCRIASRNMRKIIPNLIAKKILFSYRDYDSSTRKGTTYEIFSYEEILRRQRAAGLCYVIKNGQGIEFAVPEGWAGGPSTEDRAAAMDATSMDRALTEDHPTRVDMESTRTDDNGSRETLDKRSKQTLDVTSTPLDKTTVTRQTAAREFFAAMKPEFPDHITPAAAVRIVDACQQLVPDVTVSEISQLFRPKMQAHMRRTGIENPIGLMIHSVEDWFDADRIAAIRQSTDEQWEDTITPEENLAHYKSMLEIMPNHPQAKEWQKIIHALQPSKPVD